MSASKRPSTSSLRRFITSRPFVTVAELRRRFGLDDPDAMARLANNGTVAWIGLPEREAAKLQDLWDRGELCVELSVEVRAPVVVGVYPMRIARYVTEGTNGNGSGYAGGNGMGDGPQSGNDTVLGARASRSGTHDERAPHRMRSRTTEYQRADTHAPRPMAGAPMYRTPGSAQRRAD